jgi:hypothetical protein
MRKILTTFLLLALAVAGHAQEKQFHQEQIMGRNWIVLEMDDLKKNTVDNYMHANTYTRYSMDSFVFQVCREPVFGSHNINWNLSKGNLLQMDNVVYRIEELTDSTMTIVNPKVLRIKFIEEGYMSCLVAKPAAIDSFNNKPVYKASVYLSPHYEFSLLTMLPKDLDGVEPGRYTFSFIVTDRGQLGNIVISPQLPQKFEREIIKKLESTSRNWSPAYLCGMHVQALVHFIFEYKGVVHY